MAAIAQPIAPPARHADVADPEWPDCEQQRLPGDGSLRWLGLLLLAGSGLLTVQTLVWAGAILAGHF